MDDKWKAELTYGDSKRPTLDEQLSGKGFQPGIIWDSLPTIASRSNGMKSSMLVIDSIQALENSQNTKQKKKSLEDDLDDKHTGKVFVTPLERLMDQKREANGNTDKKTRSKKKSKKRKKK